MANELSPKAIFRSSAPVPPYFWRDMFNNRGVQPPVFCVEACPYFRNNFLPHWFECYLSRNPDHVILYDGLHDVPAHPVHLSWDDDQSEVVESVGVFLKADVTLTVRENVAQKNDYVKLVKHTKHKEILQMQPFLDEWMIPDLSKEVLSWLL